jgi:hypothetical protein
VIVAEIFIGCNLMDEYFHMKPPEVTSITPPKGYVEAATVTEIRIYFSEEMSHGKTEEACTFSEDDEELNGRYQWSGQILQFTPFTGIRENHIYTVTVGSDVEDVYGNSLLQEVNHVFFTGTETSPPEVVRTQPHDGEQISDMHSSIIIEFDEAIHPLSFLEGFGITPEITGSVEWNAEQSMVTFTPLHPYESGEEYEVSLSTDIRDASGNPLSDIYDFTFTAGEILEYEIAGVFDTSSGTELYDTTVVPYTSGIEKDDEFTLSFTNPVPLEEQSDIPIVNPSVSFSTEWDTNNESCVITFESPLEYGELYEFIILGSYYRFMVDGPHSRPVSVSRVVFVNDTTIPNPVELGLNDSLTIDDSDRACFDIYLQHAEGGNIDTAAFMDSFSVTSPGFQSFIFSSYTADAEAFPSAPLPAGNESIIRASCGIEMVPGLSSLCDIRLDSSLSDSYDNTLSSDYHLTVQVSPP